MTDFPHSFDIIPGALLFRVGNEMEVSLTRRIAAFMRILDSGGIDGIYEIVPSYTSILVFYDETINTRTYIDTMLRNVWSTASGVDISDGESTITVDVVYGETFGEDLTEVSAVAGKSVEEVITLHASGTYTVGAVGFTPGFTYLIGLPPQLATPRRRTPRISVPSGSVGIGGDQTGVYALGSAGGWNLIGRSPTVLFDPDAEPPVRLALGDRVRFRRLESSEDIEWPHDSGGSFASEGDGPIEVVHGGMLTTVQDAGRYGYGRSGFAPDGALDLASLAEANSLVGNSAGLAVLEMTVVGPTLRFHRRLRFALAGADLGARLNGKQVVPGRVFETMPGDELSFQRNPASHGARAYLAVAGGFDVPLVLGSASTNLIAGIGGWHGRKLIKGDRLGVGQRHSGREAPAHPPLPAATLGEFRVLEGPQRERFGDAVWARLVSEPFKVSDDANRMGIRLLGPDLSPDEGADIVSEGIVTGSIQVTNEGNAIVMLSGHATIGGYAKIATVHPADWDRLGQLAPGDDIRFVQAP